MCRALISLLFVTTIMVCSSPAPGGALRLQAKNRAQGAPPTKRIQVNGVSLAYVEQGHGESVVFIHGFLHDFRVWCTQVPEFSKHFRVIAYSQRYRWPNTLTGDGSDVSSSVDEADLVALIRQLRLGRVHLVGHSAGASLALRVAHDHPELVRTLVLGEPGPYAVAVDTSKAKPLFTPTLVGEVRQRYERGDNEGALRLIAEGVTGEKGAMERITPCAQSVALDNIWQLKQMWEPGERESPATCEEVRRIKVPTLLVGGDHSPPIFQRVLDELERCMPANNRVVVSDSSHGLELENPVRFNELVLEFLEGDFHRRGKPTIPPDF